MLAGGVLAAGVRPAETVEDLLWELAAHADYFFRRYGWDWWQLKRQPDWLLSRLKGVGEILNELQQEQADRA